MSLKMPLIIILFYFFYAAFMCRPLMMFYVCCGFYDKMFVQEWDYNVYDYFINYKPQNRPNSGGNSVA